MSGSGLDTIVAPATPLGRSALALVRIDGPRALEMIEQLAGTTLAERVASRVTLTDDDGPIDDAIAISYVAPRSFTGNDLVEVSLHGSPAIVQRLIASLLARGARSAEAGEFTERAVMNGKIDLAQAEAIGDLIASRTALQGKLALANLGGMLSREAEEIRSALLDLLMRLESALDFADEDITFISREDLVREIGRVSSRIESLESTFTRGRATAAGITLVILGRPNAGKSTLLNMLCGTERAIVTPIPGTTRDLLRETIEIGGLPVTLVDTAGLRETDDPVESIGVTRARDAAGKGELVLYLIDASAGATREDLEFLAAEPDAIEVYTKTDLREAPPGKFGMSAVRREGVNELLELLESRIIDAFAVPEGSAAVTNERQLSALRAAHLLLSSASEASSTGSTEEIVAADLRAAAEALKALTGDISRQDVLLAIFSKFCIGK
ncbi:MAG TPA: tRNA uridine-5-carboxymethylaminomethyl(34) synthesis GTPase MnmE [Thermoanaerobaculia bacterium]|nr:tRNA uridine-5-carboxymethylaminomethyl(34) synthesis GTPase MnmE [Thermoanaerobaculia bacterium]